MGFTVVKNNITGQQITDGSVGAVDLANGSVTEEKIANSAVTGNKIADSAVSSGKIANSAVTADKLGAGSVTTAKIADTAVTGGKIAAGAVGSSHLSAALSGTISAISAKEDKNESDISFIFEHTRPISFDGIEWTPGSIYGVDGRLFNSTMHLRTANVNMIEYHSPFFIFNPNALPIMPVEYTSAGRFVRGHAESKAPIIIVEPSDGGGYFLLQYYAGRTLIDADYEAVESLSFAVPTADYYERQTSLLMPSLSMFPTFGVIGDSYASGVVALNNDFEDRYPQSWGQLLAKKTGTKCTNFSHTGLTTRTWLTHEKGLAKLQAEDAKHIYYLCLGINDHNSGLPYLGSAANIGTNADTFYGNYSKIITAIQTKAPNAKIIMFTITEYTDGNKSVAEAFNTAIINIANHYHVPYIVQDEDYLLKTNWYQLYAGHPRTYTYASMANAYERLIQKCIYKNYSYFESYQITTEHSGVNGDIDEITALQTRLTADEAAISSTVVNLIADFVIEPVIEGVTEKIVIKRYLPAAKYCIYAGDTALSNTPLALNRATVTAAGVFEGNVVTARFYDAQDNELGRTELILVSVLDQSVGRFSVIEDTAEETVPEAEVPENNGGGNEPAENM